MISIRINDTGNFMQKLLVADTFDHFLMCESEIITSSSFNLDGRINRDFYDSDELEHINDDFVFWKNIKHICFEIIKGHKVPKKLRLVFALSKTKYNEIIEKSGMSISADDIGGLYLHITYENGKTEIITGTSLNTFTMDKTLDHYWDKSVTAFLLEHFNMEIL